MRHVRTSQPRTITDPDTGRTYVVPQGGAEDGGGEAGDGEGDDATTDGETPDGDEDESSSDTDDDTGEDEEGAGSKTQVLADLRRARDQRDEARTEAETLRTQLDELRQQHETEDERRQREAAEREESIREAAQAPARNAFRITAIETAAREAGFVDPGDAPMMLRETLDTIDVDLEAATVDRDAVTELVAELAEAKPHLVRAEDRQGSPAGGADTQSAGGTTSTDPNVTLRDLARRKLSARVG